MCELVHSYIKAAALHGRECLKALSELATDADIYICNMKKTQGDKPRPKRVRGVERSPLGRCSWPSLKQAARLRRMRGRCCGVAAAACVCGC